MREGEFENWLKWRGATSDGAIKTRIFAVRKIEENLSALGLSQADLDEAFEVDAFAKLRERLKKIREDAQSGGQDFRLLMPDSENPLNRLAKWRSWIGQYGQFLADANRPEDTDKFDRAMEHLQEVFLDRIDDFDSFRVENGAFWDIEKSYKYATRGDVTFINAAGDDTPEQRGRAVYERLCQSTKQGLPLSWRTRATVLKAAPELQKRFYETIAALGEREEEPGVLAENAARSLVTLRPDGLDILKRGEVLNITLSVLGTLRPHESCWFKTSLFDEASRTLIGKRLFPGDQFRLEDFEEFQLFLMRVQSKLEDWGWQPESFEDVQGFLWVALAKGWDEKDLVVEGLTRQAVEAAMDEFDEIGLDGFRDKYGFGKPQTYWVRRPSNGKLYPAKATVGVAHGHVEGGRPLKVGEFHGGQGEQAANSTLRGLGYEVVTGTSQVANPPEALQPSQQATNLILYGPPGTGKDLPHGQRGRSAMRWCRRFSRDIRRARRTSCAIS